MKPARKPNRLPGFDYRNEEVYFVTSCVKDKACVFGEVVDGEMQLNAYGLIAQEQWDAVVGQYPYVHSHAFVVMPNHVHGLVEINQQWDMEEKDRECEWTGRDLSVRDQHGEPKIKSISGIIGAYKMTTSKLIRLAGMSGFAWHRSFHDHIVRNEDSFRRIKEYIENNPANWQEDTFRI